MALNQTDMTLQRMVISLNQLVEQLQVTQTTKKSVGLDDIIKALNLTFKTSKGDTGEIKNLLKVTKNAPNASHYEKLTKMLELLLKSYDNPDLKQISRLGITSQNLIAELGSLKDTIKSSNITGNEKANLSVLSQAIAEGQRMYAINGFGREANAFYKKATLEQLKLLKTINKHIDEGIPLKDLNKGGLLDRLKDVSKKAGKSGILSAGADMLLKGMGFGELPGQFLDMFSKKGNKGKDENEKLNKEQQLQSMKVQGVVDAKEKAQRSLFANQTVQKRASEVKNLAETTKTNLTVELSKAIADAMRTSGEVDPRFASEGMPGVADVNKIAEAINNNTFPRDEVEKLIRSAYLQDGSDGEVNGEVAKSLIKNLDEIQEYSKIISEQDNTIVEAAVGIQTSIETISSLFLDLRDIIGNELTNELNELNKLFSKSSEFKGLDQETLEGIKRETVNRKLGLISNTTGVPEDELQGLIGGEDSSGYMKEYEKQGKYTNKNKSSLAEEAFNETTFREALYGENKPKIKTPGQEFEDKIKATNTRLSSAPVPIPSDLNVPTEPIQELVPPNQEVEDNGLSLEDISEIVSDSITDFLKSFDEAMKTRDKESKEGMDILKKALLSGEIKVNVVNLKDIPQGEAGHSGSQSRPNTTNTRYGE